MLAIRSVATLLISVCAGLQLVPQGNAQASHPRAAASRTSSAPASKQETFQFIRGQLLGLSPTGFGSISDASFNTDTCTLKLIYADNAKADVNFANLDANSVFWSVAPIPGSGDSSDKFLRLTMIAVPNQPGEATFFDPGNPTTGTPKNQAILDFSLAKAAQVPDVQERIGGAIRHLISLCGGTSERKSF